MVSVTASGHLVAPTLAVSASYLVPFVEENDYFFLTTAIPSRKATRDDLNQARHMTAWIRNADCCKRQPLMHRDSPRPPANDGRVVSNFIIQALRGEDITIDGHG